jgi:hypothetical protein
LRKPTNHQDLQREMSDDVPFAEVKAIAARARCPHLAG